MKFQSCLTALFITILTAQADEYDPMFATDVKVITEKLEVHDAKRQRTLPVRIYYPDTNAATPVILFSHGLGGSCDNNPYLGEHWAGKGYVVVFIQHPGSDEPIWKDQPPIKRFAAMKAAASMENFTLRANDIPVVIDALSQWNKTEDHPLRERMNLKQIGMSGHSFGAMTTQALAGQAFLGKPLYLEDRLNAALMLSPSPPRRGDSSAAFQTIKIPCMLMTGTRDEAMIGGASAADRLNVFPHIANAAAWQVVFDKAEHSSFGERPGKSDSAYHPRILALSTAFWDAHLKGIESAKAWLNNGGAGRVLSPTDTWEINELARQE